MKKYILMTALLVQAGSATMATTAEQIFEKGLESSAHQGIEVRKGTIKALIENALYLDAHLKDGDSDPQVFSCINDIRDSIIGLNAVGVFDTFLAPDWFHDEDKPGNIMAGVLYLQQFPQEMTREIKEKLAHLSHSVAPLLRAEITKLL
ncbi:MAG: hypothetical protein H0X26_00145 [Alphaproteobacteria bacterium]|nr:hypothetical protein [Alphaproteobacteria bacterium]